MRADILEIFNDGNRNVWDDLILIRIYYTCISITRNLCVTDDDVVYLHDYSIQDQDQIRRIATIDIWQLLNHLPFLIADFDAFFSLTKNAFNDDRGVITLLVVVHTSIFPHDGNKIELYQHYCEVMKKSGLRNRVTLSEFKRIVDAIRFYRFEDSLSIDILLKRKESFSKEYEPFKKIIDGLFFPRENRIRFCIDCYADVEVEELAEEHFLGDFVKSDTDVVEILSSSKSSIRHMTPLQCAQLLSIAKTNTIHRRSTLTGIITEIGTTTLKQSMYAAEKNLLNVFVRSITDIDACYDLLLIDPSPFEVDLIARSPQIASNIVVITSSSDESDLYKLHYYDERYNGYDREDMFFYSVDEIFESDELGIEWGSVVVTICQNRLTSTEIRQIAKSLERMGVISMIVLAEDAAVQEVACNTDMQAKIVVLPSLENLPSPKYKSIIILRHMNSAYDIDFGRMLIKNADTDEQYLYFGDRKTITRESLKSPTSIRSYWNSASRGKKRKAPQEFKLSSEITVYLSLGEKVKDGKRRGKAYIKKDGKILEDSYIDVLIPCGGEIEYVEKNYIKEKRKKEGHNIIVREVIKEAVLSQFERGVTLRTVFLVEERINEFFSSEEVTLLHRILSTEVGNISADYCDYNQLCKIISSECPSGTNQLLAERLVCRLATIANELGYNTQDFGDDYNLIDTAYKYGRRNIGTNLAKHSLGIQELRLLYSRILGIGDIVLRTALLLRLLTGIELEALCALNVGDVLFGKNMTQIMIHRIWDVQLCQLKGTRRKRQKRVIPLTDTLAEYMRDICGERDSNSPLFCIEGERIQPATISKISKELLLEMGIESLYIEMVDGLNRTKRMDISELSRDVFRGTLSFHGRNFGGMFEDEINYLLGIQCTTTLGKHYIHFEKDSSQYRLKKGLEKIESHMRKE